MKVLASLAVLVAIATAPWPMTGLASTATLVLIVAVLLARLPLAGVLRRAAVVLPFCAVFAVVCVIAGDPQRAAALVVKGYLSSLTATLLVSVTPLPDLLRGLEQLGVPRFLLMVAQFVYRYLFVIAEQAQHMRLSALAKGGFSSRHGGFRAAAGALAVLFARAFDRAERIHRSMLARGFDGRIHVLVAHRAGIADYAFLAAGVGLALGLRLVFA